MIQKIHIKEFLALAQQHPVLDVRSPGEYAHAHIPGAYNLPLFSDEERKVVGTLYKQQGREQAIKTGLDYFGPKMSRMVEEAERIIKNHNKPIPIPNSQFPIPKTLLVHCWRGGMRSAGVAWLLDLYGFKVYTLNGGYKAFRNWALQQFEQSYPFSIIGGYTGSGKTQVLKDLAKEHCSIIDLEGIARHKGSAFGALGEEKQDSQEMFDNKLAMKLHTVSDALPAHDVIWLEDESQRIGLVNLPGALWKTMRQAPVYFLDVPFEDRLNYISAEYGKYKKDELVSAVMRIQKRLGGQHTKNAVSHLLEDNYKECFRILLNYYDKYYAKSLHEREHIDTQLFTIPCEQVDAEINCKKLLLKKHPGNGITDTGI